MTSNFCPGLEVIEIRFGGLAFQVQSACFRAALLAWLPESQSLGVCAFRQVGPVPTSVYGPEFRGFRLQGFRVYIVRIWGFPKKSGTLIWHPK